jgi:hypothetical protein
MLPSLAAAQPGVGERPEARIVITGAGLPLPPGTPAYGSVVIERERLLNSASGRLENVLSDVAGFQQFRRSDSRSANPSAQGATLRAPSREPSNWRAPRAISCRSSPQARFMAAAIRPSCRPAFHPIWAAVM